MTSTLVGSEMCIRDRPRTPAELAAAGGAVAPDGDAPHANSAPKPPVSYTHLTLPTICSV
eukprot:12341337-Prorocentrum_lima.AAC.1